MPRPETLARGERWIEAIRRMARASEFGPLAGEMPKGAAQAVLDEATIVLPLAGRDRPRRRARAARARAGQGGAGSREKSRSKLDNADFVRRAPAEVVEENRERLQAARDEIARLDAALRRIG